MHVLRARATDRCPLPPAGRRSQRCRQGPEGRALRPGSRTGQEWPAGPPRGPPGASPNHGHGGCRSALRPVIGHLQTVSVQLQFVQPPFPGGHAVGRYRAAGLDEVRQHELWTYPGKAPLAIIHTMPDHLVASHVKSAAMSERHPCPLRSASPPGDVAWTRKMWRKRRREGTIDRRRPLGRPTRRTRAACEVGSDRVRGHGGGEYRARAVQGWRAQ